MIKILRVASAENYQWFVKIVDDGNDNKIYGQPSHTTGSR